MPVLVYSDVSSRYIRKTIEKMEIKIQAQALTKLNNTKVIDFTIKNKNKEVVALPGLVKNHLGIKIDSKLSWK